MAEAGHGLRPAGAIRAVASGRRRVIRHDARAGPGTRTAAARGYSWRLLVSLPLLLALLSAAGITTLTVGGVLATMRSATATLDGLIAESHDAEHLWFALAQQQVAVGRLQGTSGDLRSVLSGFDAGAAEARRRLQALAGDPLTPRERLLYRRIRQQEARLTGLRRDVSRAAATGRASLMRSDVSQMSALLQQAEADAHGLVHATFAAYPGRVEAVTAAALSDHERMLILAFAVLAAEFAAIAAGGGRLLGGFLARFTEAAAAVRDGDFGHRLPPFRIREVSLLAETFNSMAASLARMRTRERVVHRQALILREQRAALIRERLALTVEAQEEERRRVARDLHDETAQALTAVHLSLQRLAHELPAEARAELLGTAEWVRGTMLAVRNLALDLHPHTLNELGLAPALQDWLNRLDGRVPFDVAFETDPELPRLSPEAEMAAFRIAQEALTNAARHARGVKLVNVSLHRRDGELRLAVADDGAGFDPAAAGGRPTLGLFGMRERARQAGGRLAVRSSPTGTTVELNLPLNDGGRSRATHAGG